MLKEFSKYTISTVITRGISIVSMLIITGYYSTAEYGVITLGNSYLTLFYTLFAFGLVEGTQRFYKQLKCRKQNYVLNEFLLIQLTFFMILFVLLLIIFHYTDFFKELSFSVFITVMIIGYLKAMQNILLSILQMENLSNKYAVSSIILALLDIIFIFIFVYGFHCSVEIRFVSLLICNIICSVILLLFTHNFFARKIKVYPHELKPILKFCLPCMFLPIVSWLLTTSDKIIISKVNTMSSLGSYGFIASCSSIVPILYTAFNIAFTPVFYNEYENKKKIIMMQDFFLSFYIFISLCLLIVMQIFFSVAPSYKKYSSGLFLAPLFIFSGTISACSSFNVSHVQYALKSYWILVITSIAGILNIILNFILIKKFGQIGGAISADITMFIQFYFSLVLSIKYGYCSWNKIGFLTYFLLFVLFSFAYMKRYVIMEIVIFIVYFGLLFIKSLPFIKQVMKK